VVTPTRRGPIRPSCRGPGGGPLKVHIRTFAHNGVLFRDELQFRLDAAHSGTRLILAGMDCRGWAGSDTRPLTLGDLMSDRPSSAGLNGGSARSGAGSRGVAAGWTARARGDGPWEAALRPNPLGDRAVSIELRYAVPCFTVFTYSRVCCSQSRIDSLVSRAPWPPISYITSTSSG
jgi:hypothetical protein